MQRANTIKSSLPKAYQEAFITTIENIFKEEGQIVDSLFYQLDPTFFDKSGITQDYRICPFLHFNHAHT